MENNIAICGDILGKEKAERVVRLGII